VPPRIVGSPRTIVSPPVDADESLGLSAADLDIFRAKAREAFCEHWNPAFNTTINELLKREQGDPIRLTAADLERIAFRYCTAVQKAAGRLASELADAVAYRRVGLGGEQEQQQIKSHVQRFNQESTTSETAARDLLAQVARYFTIGNPEESEQTLKQFLARTADSGLLMLEATKAIRHAAAKYGPLAQPVLKSRRGRRKGQKYQETVELERAVLEVRAALLSRNVFRPSTEEIVTELAKRGKVPIFRSWRKRGIASWNRVLSNPRYLRLAAKRLSKIRKDARPVPINSSKPTPISSITGPP
jgi:hypothetical protein